MHPIRKSVSKVLSIKDTYTEGPWLHKREGKYYLLYAAGGVPEHIAYSMSDGPLGPWKYMGEIMPLQDTGSFTNHCGVIDYKGNSYFFYHNDALPEDTAIADRYAWSNLHTIRTEPYHNCT